MEPPLAVGGISPSGRRHGVVGPPARSAGAQEPARPRTAPPRDISALGGMLEDLDNDSTFGGGAYFRFLEGSGGPSAPLGTGHRASSSSQLQGSQLQPSCGIRACASAEHLRQPQRPQTATDWSIGAADPALSATLMRTPSGQDLAQLAATQALAQSLPQGILRRTGSHGSELAASAQRDVSPPLLKPQPRPRPQQPQPQQPQQQQPPQHVQFMQPPTYAPSVASVPMNLLDELAKLALYNNDTPPPPPLATAPSPAMPAPLYSHDPLYAAALQALPFGVPAPMTPLLPVPTPPPQANSPPAAQMAVMAAAATGTPPPGPQAPLPQASLPQPQMLGMQPPMSMPMPCMPSGVMPNYFGSGGGLLTPPLGQPGGLQNLPQLGLQPPLNASGLAGLPPHVQLQMMQMQKQQMQQVQMQMQQMQQAQMQQAGMPGGLQQLSPYLGSGQVGGALPGVGYHNLGLDPGAQMRQMQGQMMAAWLAQGQKMANVGGVMLPVVEM